jgi:hypothetical protein
VQRRVKTRETRQDANWHLPQRTPTSLLWLSKFTCIQDPNHLSNDIRLFSFHKRTLTCLPFPKFINLYISGPLLNMAAYGMSQDCKLSSTKRGKSHAFKTIGMGLMRDRLPSRLHISMAESELSERTLSRSQGSRNTPSIPSMSNESHDSLLP